MRQLHMNAFLSTGDKSTVDEVQGKKREIQRAGEVPKSIDYDTTRADPFLAATIARSVEKALDVPGYLDWTVIG
ncbi:hypothetical protein CABS01_10760 [Colletotrichum abscissum]|uniref:Uncharacterized protein n=4 Tax=Colletotrichum acutatum species complex TaxID=2707335 RepID=A0A9P9XN94_9PEZI|nr:uncharacterized protein CLUP02_16036 [Colletotrichum lupini]XP_060311787.1 uncharacterized protein CCOS01_08927 [Colletotrichum costaricense]XP_060379180.1 uncharacterized protein CTAM01_10219 [Colletotrichum tamarilloi]XP_060398839.1 uncharacterized protein CABS01_10760 [Colletotrichum abscissum]KAI3543306.1 hypothetical protein CSPX01_06302 [Colletotrichum filicis]KAI3557381.1 hypothetical protein CABS02_02485 [Colletotrichum abscissum]KAK1491896.1 hypothetical protein CTAM01_10219 [Coll